jgi:hypothetical protein
MSCAKQSAVEELRELVSFLAARQLHHDMDWIGTATEAGATIVVILFLLAALLMAFGARFLDKTAADKTAAKPRGKCDICRTKKIGTTAQDGLAYDIDNLCPRCREQRYTGEQRRSANKSAAEESRLLRREKEHKKSQAQYEADCAISSKRQQIAADHQAKTAIDRANACAPLIAVTPRPTIFKQKHPEAWACMVTAMFTPWDHTHGGNIKAHLLGGHATWTAAVAAMDAGRRHQIESMMRFAVDFDEWESTSRGVRALDGLDLLQMVDPQLLEHLTSMTATSNKPLCLRCADPIFTDTAAACGACGDLLFCTAACEAKAWWHRRTDECTGSFRVVSSKRQQQAAQPFYEKQAQAATPSRQERSPVSPRRRTVDHEIILVASALGPERSWTIQLVPDSMPAWSAAVTEWMKSVHGTIAPETLRDRRQCVACGARSSKVLYHPTLHNRVHPAVSAVYLSVVCRSPGCEPTAHEMFAANMHQVAGDQCRDGGLCELDE